MREESSIITPFWKLSDPIEFYRSTIGIAEKIDQDDKLPEEYRDQVIQELEESVLDFMEVLEVYSGWLLAGEGPQNEEHLEGVEEKLVESYEHYDNAMRTLIENSDPTHHTHLSDLRENMRYGFIEIYETLEEDTLQ